MLRLKLLKKNDTWEMTYLSHGAKKFGLKWVYKTKYNENGEVDKYKARLVAKGYSQKCGIDYTKVFSPVSWLETVRLVISLAAQNNWVPTRCAEQKVYRPTKDLYELKQALWSLNRNDKQMCIEFKTSMMKEFDMTDLRKVRYFIGIEVLSLQEIKRKYMEHPTKMHFQAAKKVLRYIMGTVGLGILCKKGIKKDGNLVAYTDSDYARDLVDRKSTLGYAFLLNSAVVSWSSKKQLIVTLSTTKSKFVAAISCACQAIWLRRIIDCLDHVLNSSTTIFCDNSSVGFYQLLTNSNHEYAAEKINTYRISN
ncbi:retrovirus-related pol polyprotein from transposon TNT 1-94 [Tanacetum coccineum]